MVVRWVAVAVSVGSLVAAGLAGSSGATAGVVTSAAPPLTAGPGMMVRVLARGGQQSKPDDITVLGDRLYVSFQNGVGPLGQPAPGGGRRSTIVEFTLSGHRLRAWAVVGKCDGLTADPARHRIIGTVNEDGHSSLFTLTPAGAGRIRHFAYSSLSHGGGTDSISIMGDRIFIAASAPTPAHGGSTFTGPALYEVTLTGRRAVTRPVLRDNVIATDAVTGRRVRLNLSDPDSTEVVPAAAPRFRGQLLLDSQGDSEQIFLSHPGTSRQTVTVLRVGTQVNDTAFATRTRGTLYVTDNAANSVDAITGSFPAGTVWTAAPADSGVGSFVGVLHLGTGAITPFAIGFASPAGLLFQPAR